MKITSKMFNEEFLDAQQNLTPTKRKPASYIKSDSKVTKAKSVALLHPDKIQSQPSVDAGDMEDARLNKIKLMENQDLDYANLT